MNTKAIEDLFSHNDCKLEAFHEGRYIHVCTGPFATLLEFYYLANDWKRVLIKIPNGGIYPQDYRK